MDKIFVNNIGDLTEAQRASFYRFLSLGISEELEHFSNPFIAKIKGEGRHKIKRLIYLYPNEIKLKGPNLSLDTCLRRSFSYSIQLYVKAEYYSVIGQKYIEKDPTNINKTSIKLVKKTNIKTVRIKKDLFFGEIPLMTEEGTFILNGCERVVISQIIRSPGIYFRKEYGLTKKTIYTATIISNKGLWTKIILDQISFTDEESSNREKECQREFLLREETYKESFEEEIKRGPNFRTVDESYKRAVQKEREKRPSSRIDEIKYEFKDRIYLFGNGTKGETKFTKKQDSDDDKIFIYDLIRYFGLNYEELFNSLKYPLTLKNFQYTKENENSNIRLSTEELAQKTKQFIFNIRASSFSIGEIGRYKINKKLGLNLPKTMTYLTAQDFVKIIDGLIELKYKNRVSDDIDDIRNKQIRCVGDLLQNQLRAGLLRLKKSVKDQLTVSKAQRMSFDFETYLDPDDWIMDPRPVTNTIKEFFKTSQLSQFMDQINPLSELTHKRRISVFGPNGLKRDHISTVIRDIHPSQYGRLCPIETPEGQNAGLITSLAMFGRISSLGSIETPYFFMNNGRVFSEKRTIFLNPEQESETVVAFADVSFNKHKKIINDYLSVKDNYLFSLKELKNVNFITTSPLQLISLATSLIPFIEHDDANRALMGSNMQRQAVPLLYTQKPIVGTGFESIAPLDSSLVIKNYSHGKVIYASSIFIKVKDFSTQSIIYYLKKYYRSNQETAINQKPVVWKGEEVFSGQVIADGPGTNDAELSLGRNLTIAYMPWEGYNYEDAIVINERIITEDCLTSVHIEEYETNISYCENGKERVTRDIPQITKYVRRHLANDGIVQIGSYVKEHDILVGKLTPCEEDNSPEAKLIRALYGVPLKDKPKPFRDTSLRVAHGTDGRVIDIRVSAPIINKEDAILSNSSTFIRIFIAQIRKVKIGDKLAGRHGNKGIISRILPRQDMPYLPDGSPIDIIFNPLGVPSRMNVGQVFECLLGLAGEKLGNRFKISPFDEIYGKEASRILVNQKLKEAAIKTKSPWLFNSYSPGKILLQDGRTGEYFDNPILVGKSYILKLIHLVEDKIHARATGPYSMITEQPLAGKSQRGGQRFGEMEVWALEAYGCSNTLQELLTIKSDDIDGRNDMYEAILVRKEIIKPNPSIPEAFLALIRELNALGLDLSFKKFQGGFHSTTNIKEVEKNLFQDIEIRLKLRALLARKNVEQYTKPGIVKDIVFNSLVNKEKKPKLV